MSTGAMVVGIIGGVAGLVMGVIVWTLASIVSDVMGFVGTDGSGVLVLGTLVLALSVAGMVGGALVKAKPLPAGILMLIGGAGGFFLLERFWLLPGILLIIGGVIALWVFKSQRSTQGSISAEMSPLRRLTLNGDTRLSHLSPTTQEGA